MKLAHDDRQALRLAVSAAKRERLAIAGKRQAQAAGLCSGVSLNGLACVNRAGPDGLCGVHRRYAS